MSKSKTEIWKKISWVDKIDPDKYSVSSKGRVRNNYNGEILLPSLRRKEYSKRNQSKGVYYVNLYTSSFNTTKSICRLVAHAFVSTHGIDEKGLIAYNKNGDISDNSSENISWIIGGPNLSDSKIDISYIDKINNVIIKYNYLPNSKLVKKINKLVNVDISIGTVQKYRSLISNNFQYVKDTSSAVNSFWSNDEAINKCKNNSLKSSKSVIKYDIDRNIIDRFQSVKETLRKCRISDRTFYRHMKCKNEYPYITDKTGEKYILEYSKE